MAESGSTLTAVPVHVDASGVALSGDLNIPTDARGLVAFSHGSGSSRFSPRNRAVADVLLRAHLATLMLDLLTRDEERVDQVTAELRFDIPLLGRRVIAAVDWAVSHPSPCRSVSSEPARARRPPWFSWALQRLRRRVAAVST